MSAREGDLDYDNKVMVETSQVRGRDVWFRPVGGVVNQMGPFHIEIPPTNSNEYIQASRAGLEVTCRIVRADGSNIRAVDDVVAPMNLLGACMWSECEISVNNNPLPGASAIHVGVKQFMETILTYDMDSMNTHLMSQFFYPDSPANYDNHVISMDMIKRGYLECLRNGTLGFPTFPNTEKPMLAGGNYGGSPEQYLAEAEEAVYQEAITQDGRGRPAGG